LDQAYFDYDLYSIPEELSLSDISFTAPNVILTYSDDYEANSELLLKILGAVGLDMSKDVDHIQLEKGKQINISKAVSTNTRQIIAFGIAQDKLGINAKFRAYSQYPTETYNILLSHSLKKLTESKDHKKALWESLKTIYT